MLGVNEPADDQRPNVLDPRRAEERSAKRLYALDFNPVMPPLAVHEVEDSVLTVKKVALFRAGHPTTQRRFPDDET